MARKIYKPEEIVNLLRQVEVAVANGKMTPPAGLNVRNTTSVNLRTARNGWSCGTRCSNET